jgi:hypothetical protein
VGRLLKIPSKEDYEPDFLLFLEEEYASAEAVI